MTEWTKERHAKMRALVARVQNPQMIVGQHGAHVRDAHQLWEDKVAMLAEAEEAIPDMLDDIERLRSEIDCACNALTDSIQCSGNDATTNLAWVRKLRGVLDWLP